MTTPGQPLPDSQGTDYAWVSGSDYGQNRDQDYWDGVIRGGRVDPYNTFHFNLFDALGNVIQQIGDAITGLFPETPSDALVAIRDAQRDLSDAIDYLQDVSGYANMVMSVAPTFGSNWTDAFPHYVRFDQRIGPTKNAHAGDIVLGGGAITARGIIFEKKGTWRIDAMVTSHGSFTVGGWAAFMMEITVIDMETKRLYSQKMLYNEVVEWHRTYTLSHTAIIPEDGRYGVVVGIRHARNGAIEFPKGDNFSFLSVNRWDIDTGGEHNPAPDPELPDE